MSVVRAKTKTEKFVAVMEDRIRRGTYAVRDLPTEHELAAELGASRNTARRAILNLIEKGIVVREPYGRLTINREHPGLKGQPQLAFLMDAYPSPVGAYRLRTLERLAEQRGWSIKATAYTYERDPLIFDVLDRFDGVFMVPPANGLPGDVITRFQSARCKLVILNLDVSAHGLPCLRFDTPSFAIPRLLDSLSPEAQQSVACLNTQHITPVIRERIEHWRLWSATHRSTGPLIDEPVAALESTAAKAREVIVRRLDSGDLECKAIFCTTGAAALGVMRGLADRGLRAGRDIAVCAADDHGGEAPFFTPSLTCVAQPNIDPYLRMCLDWFGSPDRQWPGPLLVQPHEVALFQGESTAWERPLSEGA